MIGKNETENCRQQLSAAKSHAESIAVITPELEQEFLKVNFSLNFGQFCIMV